MHLAHEILIMMKCKDCIPVHVRTRKIAQGKMSVYLDIVKDGARIRENLGLYLVPEKTRADKAINRATMRIAEEIKAKRLVELMEGKVVFNRENTAKVNLLEWLEQQREYYYDHDNMNYSRTIRNLTRHIELFDPAHPNAKLGSGEEYPHINYWDFTKGKRNAGGISGVEPIKK